MSLPVWVLLGFAAWTLFTLFTTIGVYRWSRILSARSEIREFVADMPQGPDWYRRAMRAHMNCVENLPVYAAIVVAMIAAHAEGAALDALAVVLLVARIAQTCVHVFMPPTNLAASLRFACFFAQVVCMIWMGILVAAAAS